MEPVPVPGLARYALVREEPLDQRLVAREEMLQLAEFLVQLIQTGDNVRGIVVEFPVLYACSETDQLPRDLRAAYSCHQHPILLRADS